MSLVVPKRKVRARVILSNAMILDGSFYVALLGRDGKPETLRDRLHDFNETYLPFALEDRHVLLRKALILTVEIAREEMRPPPANTRTKELRFRLDLWDGRSIIGRTFASVAEDRSRALDYLNINASGFLDLVLGDRVTLVNADYVAAVTEVFVADSELGSWAGARSPEPVEPARRS